MHAVSSLSDTQSPSAEHPISNATASAEQHARGAFDRRRTRRAGRRRHPQLAREASRVRGRAARARSTWPAAADAAGWARIVALGRLADCPPELVVDALRACFVDGEKRLVNALASHVSDSITRQLRRMIGTGHANRGEDIIERAHASLMESIFDPTSTDGNNLGEAFFARVRFRGIDAARDETLYQWRNAHLAIDDDGEVMIPCGDRLDGERGSIDVNHAIASIRDPNKRLAFRLYMEGMRVYSGDPSVSSVLGCSPKTAARWIASARALLAAEFGC